MKLPNIFNRPLVRVFLFFCIGVFLYSTGNALFAKPAPIELTYSDFIQALESGEVETAIIGLKTNSVKGKYSPSADAGTTIDYLVAIEPSPELLSRLEEHISGDIVVDNKRPSSAIFMSLLASILPIIIIFAIVLYVMRGRGLPGQNKTAFSVKSPDMLGVKFDDVAGIDEVKGELREITDFLSRPDDFVSLGGEIPRGLLLEGPPGTGKTMLAKALAGESGVPFISVSGSTFVQMFAGLGAMKVRQLFDEAKKNAPCIIFIDEIDAIGRKRGPGFGGGHDEREQTLNELLVQLDGFDARSGVVIVGATNRVDVLDAALLRPGRFDRKVMVSPPDLRGRRDIVDVYLARIKADDSIDADVIARTTSGFTGADLKSLINEAALMAGRVGSKAVSMAHIDQARDKIIMGLERASMVMTEQERQLTAFHEAGHALVAALSPLSDPVHKATITPRGGALGMVARMPLKDRYSMSYEKLKQDLAITMAGRAAERIKFGDEAITSGASSDIAAATRLARHMVMEAGMGKRLGPVMIDITGGHNGLPYDQIGAETKRLIEDEIIDLISAAEKDASSLIKRFNDEFCAIADLLMEKETVGGKMIDGIVFASMSKEDAAAFHRDSGTE